MIMKDEWQRHYTRDCGMQHIGTRVSIPFNKCMSSNTVQIKMLTRRKLKRETCEISELKRAHKKKLNAWQTRNKLDGQCSQIRKQISFLKQIPNSVSHVTSQFLFRCMLQVLWNVSSAATKAFSDNTVARPLFRGIWLYTRSSLWNRHRWHSHWLPRAANNGPSRDGSARFNLQVTEPSPPSIDVSDHMIKWN